MNPGPDPTWEGPVIEWTHFDHYCENCGVECAEHETIQGQDENCESAKFTETPDMTVGPHEENGDLEGVIPKDTISHLIDSLKHNVTGKLHLATPPPLLNCGACNMRMSEYSACQTKRFVEANGADQKGEGFNEANRVEGDVEIHRQGESE